jgi:predicted kinase
MLKCILTVGAPACGKSTWAKTEVAKDPDNWVRVNNDDIRAMTNGSVYSASYEKLIADTRNFLIREAFKRDKNVIIDNVNANKRHFADVCKMAQEANKDIQVFEKLFYVELEELLARDSKREGKAQVGEAVVKKWFKDLGGKQFRFSNAKVEIFTRRSKAVDRIIEPMQQDESLSRAVIFDNDGTISLIHSGRSPYDASTCDLDVPHAHVIECMKLYFNAGYKILFVSGREDKDRAPTEKFYQQHFPEVKYELYMRKTGDMRKDVIIKEEIFNEHIKPKYFVAGWFDDRLQVSKWVYESGLPLFRVNDPEANF